MAPTGGIDGEENDVMHPDFVAMMIRDRQRELEASMRRGHLRWARRTAPAAPLPSEPVVLRLEESCDGDALARIAALERRPLPDGPKVVAEVGGVVVAALPLEAGPAIADPSRTTAHLIPLLELRARQLTPQPKRRFGRRSVARLDTAGRR
jgi:hypothetical protein